MTSAEQLEIQALAREFARAALRPRSAEWDAARTLDESVFAELAELGFLGMLIGEEHGGLALDYTTYAMVLEELAWGDAAVALAVGAHNGPVATLLARHGSAEQKAKWLPELASGRVLGAFALSEAAAGSDASALTTNARPTGSGWILDGEKRWVSNGARAGLVILFARVEGEGIGVFLLDPRVPGVTIGERARTLGLRASETVPLRLTSVTLGSDALVGDAAEGLRYGLEALDVGRVGGAALAVGVAQAAFEHAASYALQREQFDRPIAAFGAIQEKLARMAERVAASRALTHAAAAELDDARGGAGHPHTGLAGTTARAALAKVVASEAATWVADEAIQVFGGYGYMRHYPVEKLLRDAKGTEIFDGTSEIMRHVVAREVLRDFGDTEGADATAVRA